MLVDGFAIAREIKNNLKKKIKKLKSQPGLGIILVGRDRPSQTFVANKIKFCQEVGIRTELVMIKESAKGLREETEAAIIKFNKARLIHGIILQLPLPAKLKPAQEEIFNLIDPQKDIDCFNFTNLGLLSVGKSPQSPAVVRACLEILLRHKINIKGKTILVVGWGQIVGKPLVPVLLQKGATVIVCNEFTKNLSDFSSQADIIISAVGKPNILNGKMVKKGVIAIDVGSSFRDGKIHGDFDFASLHKKAKLITPVPGGIGPVTVAMVAKSVLENYLKVN